MNPIKDNIQNVRDNMDKISPEIRESVQKLLDLSENMIKLAELINDDEESK